MNNNKILLTVVPGVIALTALLLSVRLELNADALFGMASLLAVIAIAAIEYRFNWKRLLGR